MPDALKSTSDDVIAGYDLVMLDLDGVVYISKKVIDSVPEVMAEVVDRGVSHAYITNNASRTPESVAEQLGALGLPATVTDVVTSAQAAARLLRTEFGTGARVVCLGAAGLREALLAEELEPVAVGEAAVALATGYGPDVVWRDIMRAAVRVRGGLPWVASNTDGSIPTDFGIAPGHGVFVKMLSGFSEVVPRVAGKPERPLFDETIRRVGGERPLMVGDRLDTDILGANRAGLDSLLVLTGVSGVADLTAAAPELRPTYISATLRGLLSAHPRPTQLGTTWVGEAWRGEVVEGRLMMSPTMEGSGDVDDWWRVVASAAWDWLDTMGSVVDISNLTPPVPRRDGAGK